MTFQTPAIRRLASPHHTILPWVLPILSLILFVAAGCGGGAANDQPAYKIDLSTPEGAIEAYGYAIAHRDEKVAEQVYILDEREALLQQFRKTAKATLEAKLTYRFEMHRAEGVKENIVVGWGKWIQMDEDGKDTGKFDERWVAFVKDTDGKWHSSRIAAMEYEAWLRQQEQKSQAPANAPANAPTNAPSNGD